MEGGYLDEILKTNNHTSDSYHGIFSFDETWPLPHSLPASYVFNTQKRHEIGVGHWISFQINKDRSVDYMDSYGTAPMVKPFNWFKRGRFGPVRYNTKWLQSPYSTICWAYVIHFLVEKGRGLTLAEILAPFETYQWVPNDGLVLSRLCPENP